MGAAGPKTERWPKKDVEAELSRAGWPVETLLEAARSQVRQTSTSVSITLWFVALVYWVRCCIMQHHTDVEHQEHQNTD